jgi:hypothetical protein
MSGTVAIDDHVRWSAAGWLFDWTLNFLADSVSDPRTRDEILEILDENLGWLGLSDFDPPARRELRGLLADRLMAAAAQKLPPTLAGREPAIALLRDLAEKARNG